MAMTCHHDIVMTTMGRCHDNDMATTSLSSNELGGHYSALTHGESLAQSLTLTGRSVITG